MKRCDGLLADPSRVTRVLLGLFLIGATVAYGQQDVWQGPTDGSWFTGSYWSLGAPPTASESALIANGTVVQIQPGTAVAASVIVAAGSTLQAMGGTLTMSGLLTIQTGGTVEFTNGEIFDGGIVDNGSVVINNPVGGGLSGAISGTGSFTVDIKQTLSVSGGFTYTGPTYVNAGTLQAASIDAFSSSSAFAVNSTLDLNGFSNAIGSLSGTGIVLNGSRGTTATLTIDNVNDFSIYSGVIENGAGILALTKTGSGNMILTGTNTYTGGTTILGGSIQLGNGTTTGSITGNVVDDGELIFDRTDTYTFAGVISGTGAVTQMSAGTIVLTGNNTYSGGTTIFGGTVQIGNGGTTGSISGNVIDNASLAFDRSDVLTFGGVINGRGIVEQIGTGTTVLTGNNSYIGGTLISSGTLQLGNGGTTGSIAGNVTDNGILAFDRSDIYIFGGPISGTGAVQQIGSGTTVLTANNTYGGGTTISAGTLVLGNGGTTGSVTGNVTDNGILAFDHSDVFTFSGLISGSGALRQIGTGTTVLTGSNTYTGGTTISAGTLQLGNGGTTGSIIGDITDNGILAFDHSDLLPIIGVITGTGTVQQIGTGTTVLIGNNRYSGGTIIRTGTLQLGDGEITGSIIGNVLDYGVFAFDRSDVLTLSGIIGGTGVVQQIGTGTTVLTANNTYSGGTTISAGTLQLGNGGTTGSVIGNVTDNGVLAFDRSNGFTFGGRISGAGAVQQIGAGITILTANNSYNGGTTISAGTLQLGNGGTTGSVIGNVINNGTLAFDHSDTFTFAGTISGAGGVQQIGTGTLVLTGNNTYSGETTISTGTLQVGNGGTSGNLTAQVSDDGILAFDRSDVFTFGGAISGTGQVLKRGGGTLTLTSKNTYSGQTMVNAGTLQAGSAGAFSANSAFLVNPGATLDLNGFNSTIASLSGSGTVLNHGAPATLTVGNNNNDTLFSGVLENGTSDSADGRFALTKVGSGTLTLTATNTYTGLTTVDDGSLIINGSIASTQTLVEPEGLLAGTGLIGGNLVNNGIVSPGDAPGTLTVSGNYTQSPTGTLSIEISGLATGQYSLLLVGGHASLAGTLRLIALNSFKLQVGNQVTFLIARRGVSGAFATIENPFISNTIVKADVVTSANTVQIVGTQGDFVTAACNPNNASVARALNSAVGAPQASALITYLDNQPLNTLCSVDFTAISPEKLAAVYSVGISLANVESANLERRMDDIRTGSHGFDGTGFTINGGLPSFTDSLVGPSGAEGKNGPSVTAPIPENRLGFFTNGLGQFIHVDGTEGASGFALQTGGVTLGADYRIGSNFAIGLNADYAHSGVDLVDNSNIDVNSGKFGLYTTLFGNGFYLDGAITGGWSQYDTHRTALLGNANGSTDGADLNVLVDSGYDWTKGDLTVGPTATFQYSYVSFNGFTETGSLAPLKYKDQSVDSIRSAFGMKASYNWKINSVIIKPELSAAWQHEYADSAYSIVANFANGAGNSFTVTGPRIGRNSLLLGAGVSVLFSDRVSTYVYYDGELGRTNYQSNAVSGGVRITF